MAIIKAARADKDIYVNSNEIVEAYDPDEKGGFPIVKLRSGEVLYVKEGMEEVIDPVLAIIPAESGTFLLELVLIEGEEASYQKIPVLGWKIRADRLAEPVTADNTLVNPELSWAILYPCGRVEEPCYVTYKSPESWLHIKVEELRKREQKRAEDA